MTKWIDVIELRKICNDRCVCVYGAVKNSATPTMWNEVVNVCMYTNSTFVWLSINEF